MRYGCLFLYYLAYDIVHVGPDVCPAVVRPLECLYGQRCLVLVEQHLHQHVFLWVLGILIEHELDVARHREHVVHVPILSVDLVERRAWVAVAVDVEQADKRQHVALVGKAHGGAGMRQGDACVGSLHDVLHEIELSVHSGSVVELVRSSVRIPESRCHEPLVVELLLGEDVPHGLELMAQLRALQGYGRVEQLLGKRALVHVLSVVGVIEDGLHHVWCLVVALIKRVQAVHGCLGAGERRVRARGVIVHVVHVVVRSVALELYFRVERGKLQQLVLHRQYAANDHRGACVNVGDTGEHLRETLEHALGNATVLLGAQLRQFSFAAHALSAHLLHQGKHLLASWGELAERVGMGKSVVRLVERVFADKPARAMTTVVADIERLVTTWRRRELLGWHGIVAIVVGGEVWVLLDFLSRALGVNANQRQREKGK